ncbi:hypothetical protein [Planctomonas psychrotolerans]|uniref:hypothetical protein n=1 Tax=Planctomonas psychrotolerans TaxID=2528712 RepID=UPI001D0D5EEA|nr:hypothetical protein [Planctomonas psychrotolerans]
MKIILVLLAIWLLFSILGLVIEGLLWLAVIGIVLAAATVIWGMVKRKSRAH